MSAKRLQESAWIGFRLGFLSGMCAMAAVPTSFVSWWCSALFLVMSGFLAWVNMRVGVFMRRRSLLQQEEEER